MKSTITGRALMVVQHSHFLIISLYVSGVFTTAAGESEWPLPVLGSGPEEILDNPFQKENHLVTEIEQKLLEPNRYRSEFTDGVKRNIVYVPGGHHSIQPLESNRIELSEHLRIELVERGVTFVEIRWRMENRTGHVLNVQPKLSRVRCYLGNATLLDKLNSTGSRLRIENLLSSTRYTVCVEAVLDLPPVVMTHTRNDDNDVVYSGCVSLTTIPLLRTDSIVALALTLGYVILLPLLGYVTWLLRVRRQATNRKGRESVGPEARGNGQDDAPRELSTIEETSRLTANFSRKPVSL